MAIAETIESMRENLSNAYTSLEGKGATIPTDKNLYNLASTIDTVTAGGGEEDLSVELTAQDVAITELEEVANSLPDAAGGGGVTDGLARYIAGDTTLTELKASDFGSIESLAKYAFYRPTSGSTYNPVTLKKIGLPNTITTIGIHAFSNHPVEEITGIDFDKLTSLRYIFSGTTNLSKINNNTLLLNRNVSHEYLFNQGGGKLQDLKVTIDLTNTSAQSFRYAFAGIGNQTGTTLGTSQNEFVINGDMTSMSSNSLNYMFSGVRAKKVIFKDATGYKSSSAITPFNYMFQYCYIDEVEFTKATHLYSGTSGGYRMFQTSKIGRLRLPALTTTLYVFYGSSNPIEKIFLGSNCALSSTSDIQTNSKYFFPYDNYYTYAETTNWITKFNTTVGTTDTKMFAYKDFNEGDYLEESWGGQFADDSYRTYTIEWFEDDDFTIPVTGVTSKAGTHYARFTLTEYNKEIA